MSNHYLVIDILTSIHRDVIISEVKSDMPEPFRVLESSLSRIHEEELRKLSPLQVEYAEWYSGRRMLVKAKFTKWTCLLDDVVRFAWIIPGAIVRRDLPDWCRPLWGAIRKIDRDTDRLKKEWLQRLSSEEVREVEDLVLHEVYLDKRASYHEAEERAKG